MCTSIRLKLAVFPQATVQIDVFHFAPENNGVAGYADEPELWSLHQQGNLAFVGQSTTARLASNGV
jgi:hypothetical protein